MGLVVLDIECFENKTVKELGVYKNRQTMGYSFLSPKKLIATTESAWCTKHLRGINWNSGHEKYTGLEKIFCQKFWKQGLNTWMNTHVQKVRH